jgi:hypothetical protein
MPNSFALYSPASLPHGFRYPDAFRAIAEGIETPSIGSWWFVDAASDAGKLFFSVREHDGRNLIPFAKMADDIACFDGEDHTGNPPVLALVLDDSGRAYGFADFSSWLAKASSTSA